MPTTQRGNAPGIIGQLLDAPYRFDFVQAVRLLERWMVRHGVPRSSALTDYLQFQNSTSLNFPASEIEALSPDVDAGAAVRTQAQLSAALAAGQLQRIRITPAFIGFLGNQGAMPNHYSERIAARERDHGDQGPRAFIDLFSNRMVALFYLAWRKHRLELTRDDGNDGLLPLLLALSGGGGGGTMPDAVAAYYAAAFRQRPVTAAAMQRVLSEYFAIPVTVIPNLGRWHLLAPDQSTRLGKQNNRLGAGFTLGPRLWRRDLKVGIRLGPLNRAQHDHFLKDAAGAAALKSMLSMFETPTLQYEVQLVLRGAEMRAPTLDAAAGLRLGMNCVLSTRPATADWGETRYLIQIA
ncbi:type VI secretion system baseplate subunit TssG [Rugamonas sp.]|uniref:type VI secretion system baseplate subunit TssG n=1 Tax=Rugamonas sp. TaxID=1926287 RepID=UPI0025D2A104|nr:type VI secretion system baseplate subunit TssG [Rugamonas sp.]